MPLGSRGRPPRVLYLAFFFPPSRASGVFRGRATANHLAEAGWDVTVHTAPREFFETYLHDACDPSLEETVDPRVKVVRPRMTYYAWERDIRQFGKLRRNFPTVAGSLYKLFQDKVFPEHYLSWIPGVISEAVKAHFKDKFDVILATGNPFCSFAAARMLSKLLKIPYVVDYRDAWTFNQFTEQLKFKEDSKAFEWEEKVLRDASEIVFVNDGMRQWHIDRYPNAAERMTVVPNGWEPELLGDSAFTPPDPDRPLRFGYLGTVTSYLPLEDLFEGWRIARAHPLLRDAELNIHGHLGFFPNDRAPLMERLPLEENIGVRYHGAFGKAEAKAVYAETDALVFCVPGARYVTSGKIFEYMASGKPIVSAHRPDIAATEVLDGYPHWFRGEELNGEAVAKSFIAAAEAARSMDRTQHELAVKHAHSYTRAATLGPLEQRMRKLVEGRR
ncbi:glycosyltransferase [Streptomyces sp. NPDC020412]|uniref:glycosyltransferase n=1 Tax=Streptomyces sp. NPDC020412 TaxID=3365073 RepID=UPI0037BDE401